ERARVGILADEIGGLREAFEVRGCERRAGVGSGELPVRLLPLAVREGPPAALEAHGCPGIIRRGAAAADEAPPARQNESSFAMGSAQAINFAQGLARISGPFAPRVAAAMMSVILIGCDAFTDPATRIAYDIEAHVSRLGSEE